MQDQLRIKALEDRAEQNEIVLSLVWTGIRILLRALTAILAKREPLLKDLLVEALESGLTKFNHEATLAQGEPEMARLQKELNEHYRRNQYLLEFQERRNKLAREVCMLAPSAKTSGGVVPSRGIFSPKSNGPEIGR